MDNILKQYGALLAKVDGWFSGCIERFGNGIACRAGCSDCCRGLFDITLLDACYLKRGFDQLPEAQREAVLAKVGKRIVTMQEIWPEFSLPFVLNYRPDEEWEALMPDDDETPCVLLGNDGNCLVYDYRPMTCRLHGLPLIDRSGEVMHDEWCTRNFLGQEPLDMVDLKWEFNSLFREELGLFRGFTYELFQQSINELDTFVPTALLIDFGTYRWHRWLSDNPLFFEQAVACDQAGIKSE
jgi:Fe-S-cluster containining protein